MDRINHVKLVTPQPEVVDAFLREVCAVPAGWPLGAQSDREQLASDAPLGPGGELSMDDVLMEQVFINLIENAVKYTPAGSDIEIAAYRRDSFIEVEVRDSGPGFSPGHEERVSPHGGPKSSPSGTTRNRSADPTA